MDLSHPWRCTSPDQCFLQMSSCHHTVCHSHLLPRAVDPVLDTLHRFVLAFFTKACRHNSIQFQEILTRKRWRKYKINRNDSSVFCVAISGFSVRAYLHLSCVDKATMPYNTVIWIWRIVAGLCHKQRQKCSYSVSIIVKPRNSLRYGLT